MRSLMPYLAGLILAATCAAQEDVETFPCDTTDLWSMADLSGLGEVALTASDGEVRAQYPRTGTVVLYHNVVMTDLQRLDLTLRSSATATFSVIVQDREGGLFQYETSLLAGESRTVSIWSCQFSPTEDSPSGRAILDPSLLRTGYTLLERNVLPGENTLAVEQVEVTRAPFQQRFMCSLTVWGTETFDASTWVEKEVIVKRGAVLNIGAIRFSVGGKVKLEDDLRDATGAVLQAGGKLFVNGGVFDLRGTSAYSANLALGRGSEVGFDNAVYYARATGGVGLGKEAKVRGTHVTFPNGLTWDAREDEASIELSGCTLPGEFITSRQARLTISDSSGILLWLWIDEEVQGATVLFPNGGSAEDWSPGLGFQVTLLRCRSCLWATITEARCGVTFGSTLRDGEAHRQLEAFGAQVGGVSETEIRDLHNPVTLSDAYRYPATDREVSVVGTHVKAWNFYAEKHAHLTIRNCTYGESHAYNNSYIEVFGGECDGRGGFVQASESAKIDMHQVRVTTLIHAVSDQRAVEAELIEPAFVWLDGCEVRGDVVAAEGAWIVVDGGSIRGRIQAYSGATILLRGCDLTNAVTEELGGKIVVE